MQQIPDLTVENICMVCSKRPCDAPCETWYRLFEGNPISDEFGGG